MIQVGGRSIDSKSVVVVALSWCSPPPPDEPHDTPDDSPYSPPGAPDHAAGAPHLQGEPRERGKKKESDCEYGIWYVGYSTLLSLEGSTP